MTRKSHRGRKGDGWPRRRPPSRVLVVDARARAQTYPDVCPRNARCGHVVCEIVWYCVEAA